MKEVVKKTLKQLALISEVETSILLIKKGINEVYNLNGVYTFKHAALLLLSNGTERLLKCILLFDYFKKNGKYPEKDKFFKKYSGGHNLNKMLIDVVKIGDSSSTMTSIPFSKKELEYLKNDKECRKIISIYTHYASYGRYFDLDIATKPNIENKNPITELEMMMDEIFINKNITYKKSYSEVSHIINKELIIIIEKMTRSLCRFFTHADLGSEASIHIASIKDFIDLIEDDSLGEMKYLCK